MQPVKLLERAASTTAHALRHPISSAAYATGIVRGIAGVARHGVTGHGPGAGSSPAARLRARPVAVPEPIQDDVPPPEPTPLHESFATEPKAVSRESAHGAGPADDAEIDAWSDEATAHDVDVVTPVGTTGADVGHNPDTGLANLQQQGTEPLLDPGTAKAIRSESEMMKKDAERNPE